MSGPTPPRDQRVDAVIPVRFADAKEFLVEYTSNISLGGVFVRTASPSAFGTVVRLSLELPGTSQAVPVTGQVAFVLPADQAARQGKVPGMGVRFARLDPAVQETLAAYVETLQRKSRGRVLLVDDDAVVTQKLADLLRSHHLNVTTVSSAIKALEILRFGGVDFVISDIVMPRMDGFEFRDNVRNNPKTAGIPFIFLTSSTSPADMQLAAELGVHLFLSKPVEPGPLLALLRQVLGDAAFQPDAPGATPAESEEKLQRKRVQDRRVVEIAYRKFVALGLDTRFTADERGVYGQLTFKTASIQDPATGARLERAGLYSVGHDRAKPFWPRTLGSLPIFNVLDVPDAPSLERMIAGAFARRIEMVRQVKQFLDGFRIPNRYDAGGMRMLGQVKSGTDQIVFSVRDPKTLFLESLNGRSFGEVAGMRARLVDIADSKGGTDVEIALETAFRRLQQSMQSASEPAQATAIGADGRRQVVEHAELTEDPENAAPPPVASPAPTGEFIGEPEDEQALAESAIDVATKAAVAANIASATSPPPSQAAPPPADDVWPDAPPPDVEAAPAREDALVPAIEPDAEVAAEPAGASPFAEAPDSGTESALAQSEGAGEPPPVGDAAEAEPPAPEAAGATMLDDWSAYATPDAGAADAVAADAVAPEAVAADAVAPEAVAAEAAAPDVAAVADALTMDAVEPVAADAVEPVAADAGEAVASDYASVHDEPLDAAEPAAGELSVPPAPLTDRDTNPGPAVLEGAAFAGEEYELAPAADGGSAESAELELAAPETPAVEEQAWSARDAEVAPADLEAATPDVLDDRGGADPGRIDPPLVGRSASRQAPDSSLGSASLLDPPTARREAAAVPVQTDLSRISDMDATLVPHSEPEAPLSPEEANARKWADEWTGDESTAEPLWTIQPGEEQIKASPMVTDALETPPAVASADAPPPAAETSAPAAPDDASNTAGMTAMVCTQCGSTYHIGDEIEDERLLLVCPSCIEKDAG